jgi:hypothetical protein
MDHSGCADAIATIKPRWIFVPMGVKACANLGLTGVEEIKDGQTLSWATELSSGNRDAHCRFDGDLSRKMNCSSPRRFRDD